MTISRSIYEKVKKMNPQVKSQDIRVVFPYGERKTGIKIPRINLSKIVKIDEPAALSEDINEISKAIQNPINSEPLRNLLKRNSKVAIIISDITRPVPNNKIVPCILDELNKVSIPLDNITIVVATGMHRANTDDELKSMLGKEVFKTIKVINHNAFRSDNLTFLGKTPSGTLIEINNVVAEADIKIAIGYIEPHEFAGFTGGRKSILPGVSGVATINRNHRPEMIDHPRAKIGIIEKNPIHEDMVECARIVGLDFIVNVVLNSKNEIVRIFAGDFFDAHIEGVEYYKKYATIEIDEQADIVITALGYPLDRDLYQSIKGVIAAEPFVKKDGIIILITESRDGFGPGSFGKWMTTTNSIDEINYEIIKKGYSPEIDHCYILAKILKKLKIIIVSENPLISSIKFSDRLKKTNSIEKALKVAFAEKGHNSSIICLPYATKIIPKLKCGFINNEASAFTKDNS